MLLFLEAGRDDFWDRTLRSDIRLVVGIVNFWTVTDWRWDCTGLWINGSDACLTDLLVDGNPWCSGSLEIVSPLLRLRRLGAK